MAAEEISRLRVTKSWQADPQFKRKLVERLNKRIRAATGSLQMRSTVKVNWVSLHAREIDQARRLRVAAESRR